MESLYHNKYITYSIVLMIGALFSFSCRQNSKPLLDADKKINLANTFYNNELYEAAVVDGANWIQQFWFITFPFILPVLIVAMLFSFVRTMGDFRIVWLLTNGGPFDSTQLIATRAYQVAIQGAKETGMGSAIAVSLFPFLLPFMLLYLRYVRRGVGS